MKGPTRERDRRLAPVVRALAFHAAYRCENRGVCCTSGWPIAVEPDRRQALQPLIEARTAAARLPLPLETDDAGRLQLPIARGACVLYDRRGRCDAQAALGHAALPLACRQFPRVTVSDPRGVSVTLSHVCPTARRLLSRGDIAIVTDAPGFPADGEYVGLDAREALPPLLRRDLLMEWDSWWHWETCSVEVIAAHDDDPTRALGVLARAQRDASQWSPGRGRLRDAIDEAFAVARREPDDWRPDQARQAQWIAEAYAAIPEDLRSQAPPVAADATPAAEPASVLSRYLAAHAFANWTIHRQRNGLAGWLHSLEVAYVLAHRIGVSDADLMLRHLGQE